MCLPTLHELGFRPGWPNPPFAWHSSGDVSPPLQWGGVPGRDGRTRPAVDDPDAPIKGSFVHWVLYRIAPSRSGLVEGESPAEAQSGPNGFGRPGYPGPRRLAGDPPHRYVFRLLAVDAPIEVTGHPSYKRGRGGHRRPRTGDRHPRRNLSILIAWPLSAAPAFCCFRRRSALEVLLAHPGGPF